MPPALVGEPAAFEVPAGVDIRDIARRLAPPPVPAQQATLLARPGTGHQLRRAADRVEPGVTGPDGRADWDRIELSHRGGDLASDVLGHGPDVVVESPAALRAEVVRRLAALTAGGAA